jgi:hypothetical protein
VLGFSVGIGAAYGLDGRVSIPGKGKRFVIYFAASGPDRTGPDQVPAQPLIQLFTGAFSSGVEVVGACADLSQVLKSRMMDLYLHFLKLIHNVVLNSSSRNSTLLLLFIFYLKPLIT